MLEIVLGLVIIVTSFSYLKKLKTTFTFLENKLIFILVESTLYGFGIYLLFGSVFTAIGLALVNIFLNSIFRGLDKTLNK